MASSISLLVTSRRASTMISKLQLDAGPSVSRSTCERCETIVLASASASLILPTPAPPSAPVSSRCSFSFFASKAEIKDWPSSCDFACRRSKTRTMSTSSKCSHRGSSRGSLSASLYLSYATVSPLALTSLAENACANT